MPASLEQERGSAQGFSDNYATFGECRKNFRLNSSNLVKGFIRLRRTLSGSLLALNLLVIKYFFDFLKRADDKEGL